MYDLPSQLYSKALGALVSVPFNTLFAKAVLMQKAPGTVYVDDLQQPNSFYVLHRYGMSLLYGNAANPTFEEALITRLKTRPGSQSEYLQATPAWAARLNSPRWRLWQAADNLAPAQFTEQAKQHRYLRCKRLNLKLDPTRFKRHPRPAMATTDEVVATTPTLFNQQQGSVLARHFWHDAEDFIRNSFGISVLRNGNQASTAFAAFIIDQQLEIGIETSTHYRGEGLAELACHHLCSEALRRGYQLEWTCRDGNFGSLRLAQKLGFHLCAEHDYFCVV